MRHSGKCSLFIALSIFVSISVASADAPHSAYLRPVDLGTSGGNINDVSSIYCCSGTLGALVRDSGGTQYILSNNHVLARTNKGRQGDVITQPGLIDMFCSHDTSYGVANLSSFVPISFKKGARNTVDAAIAVTQNGKIDPSGAILDIGAISSQTVNASPGMPVKKSGRTTGLTSGTISAVNVTVDVTYNKICGVRISEGSFSEPDRGEQRLRRNL